MESKESPTQIIWKSTEEILRRADVASYKERIKAVLQSPRGRKALTMGGIPWRWAIEYLKPEDALEGPASECLTTTPVCTINGVNYYDNYLFDSEIDVLVGSYDVETSVFDIYMFFLHIY